jgi:nucleoid DNA-binding protein
MKPHRIKDLISPLAHQHGLSQEVAEKIVRSYWSYVREVLSKLEEPRVMLPNLGTFNVKHWSVDKMIKHNNVNINYLRPQGTIKSYATMKEREKDLEAMLKIQEKLATEREDRKIFKEKKSI